jgi:hypothetical protein
MHLPHGDSDVYWNGQIRSPGGGPVTDVLFKKVDFDPQVDPVRIEFTWWEGRPPTRPTTFGLWIESTDDAERKALLAVQREPAGQMSTYLQDSSTGERTAVGAVAHFAAGSPGRLVAEFPRKVISDYGPVVQWWARASVDENDLDTYVDEDADTRVLER